MNDDFAPRPCRCVVPWVISGVLVATLLPFMALAWNLSCDVTEAEATIADQQATIDQQERIIAAWVDANPPADGELEPGAMGARFIPTAKDTNERLNNLVIRVEKILDDVEAGKTGGHIKFSLYQGTADVTLRKAQ